MRRSLTSLFGRRRADGDSIAFWHAQNLNERRHGPDGPMWRAGRAWLHWTGWKEPRSRLCFGVEWSILTRREWDFKVGLEFHQTFGSDYDLATTLKLPLLGALYFHVEGLFPSAWKKDAKDTSISLYQEYLWINFWYTDPAETWGEDRNRFPSFRISLDWKSLLFGRMDHHLEYLSDWQYVQIPMPEATYPARFRIEKRTWTRRRWPGKREKVAAGIDLRGEDAPGGPWQGIPIPGKGESSWDCGEDAYMGMGSADTTASGVVSTVVKVVLEARERYGGSVNWRPQEKEAA